jgi:hypothetical protein
LAEQKIELISIMRSVFILIVTILGLLSCSSNTRQKSYSREYEHLESQYYAGGALKFERQWNDTLEGGFIDEDILWFSEIGDTAIRRTVIFSLGSHTRFLEDSVYYRFFRIWNPNFINEMLSIDQSLNVNPDESLYMYVSVLEDSLMFSYVGMDMVSYEIQLFETTKVKLEEPDFVFVAEEAQPLLIPKTTLSDHQIIKIEYLRDKDFEGDSGNVRQGFTTTFSLYEKLELQKILGMKEICEGYLSK